MLQIINKSPFAAALSPFLDSAGRNLVSTAVKGTFAIPPSGGRLQLCLEQLPVEHVETPFPEDHKHALRRPVDLVPEKVATDVGVVGCTHGRRSLFRRRVRVAVGPVRKVARVRPLGTRPVDEMRFAPVSAAVGFLAPNAKQRLKYAGTYDARWQRDQMPLPPEDLDPRFFNSATPGLVAKSFLGGTIPVSLRGLSARGAIRFSIPEISVRCTYRFAERAVEQPANLWTLFFEPELGRFVAVWGTSLDVGVRPSALQDIVVEADGVPPLQED